MAVFLGLLQLADQLTLLDRIALRCMGMTALQLIAGFPVDVGLCFLQCADQNFFYSFAHRFGVAVLRMTMLLLAAEGFFLLGDGRKHEGIGHTKYHYTAQYAYQSIPFIFTLLLVKKWLSVLQQFPFHGHLPPLGLIQRSKIR